MSLVFVFAIIKLLSYVMKIYDLMGSTKGYSLYEKNRFTISKLDQLIYGDLGYGIVLDGDNTNENYILQKTVVKNI